MGRTYAPLAVMTTPHEPQVLLTRPAADSARVAEALGVPCLISPLLELRRIGAPVPAEAVVFTSGNGVRAWVDGGGATGLPAWCVGPRTAEAVQTAGFDLRGWASDVARLPSRIPRSAPPLLHVRGRDTRGDLVATLRARGHAVEDLILYEARPVPLSDAAREAALTGPLLVPVYSPRSATLLADAWPEGALHHLRAVALSEAVARALPVVPVAITARPDGEAMLTALRHEIGG